MSSVLMGLETEYALINSHSRREHAAEILIKAVKRKNRYLPERLSDRWHLFLQNGGRWYIDSGFHPENATPEVTNPRDLVIYDKAGERIMADAAATASAVFGSEITLIKNNVDYISFPKISYGCHENYLHSRRQTDDFLNNRLIPFLVTRQIYAGSGIISSSKEGMGFELSQRSSFIQTEISDGSTDERPIWHRKDEALLNPDGQYRRIHLVLGDSLMSEFSTYLKVATTALLLKLLEDEVDDVGEGLTLADPVAALKAVSRDLSCQTPLLLKNGRTMTPIQIQRQYIHQAERFLRYNNSPSWAAETLKYWRQAIAALENNDVSFLEKRLDAYIKLSLYTQWLKKCGGSWNEIRDWGYVLRSLIDCLDREIRIGRFHVREQIRDVLSDKYSQTFLELDDYMNKRRLDWNQLLTYQQVLRQLQTLDLKYHDVNSASSLFYSLVKTGSLNHQLVSESEIQAARQNPPKDTRAFLRGQCVKRLHAEPPRAVAGWSFIQDLNRHQFLNLSHPFSTTAFIQTLSTRGNHYALPQLQSLINQQTRNAL